MSFPYLGDLVHYLTGHALPLPMPMFGILVAAAMLAGGACLRRELDRMHREGRIGMLERRAQGGNGGVAVRMAPGEFVNDFTVVVFIAGIVGARLFHILENTGQFAADPWSMIFSRSGLSVFGGLIVGGLAGLALLRRWKVPVRPFLDAIAPAMMLGYAIGRIGCQVSGDGDWGTTADMALKPDWLPTWLWAQTYDNNIYGVVIAAPGVYPTPVYETLMALACFALLWGLRRHPFQAGWLFALYMVLAGAERFLIEQIRVNVQFTLHGIVFTQAELIALASWPLAAPAWRYWDGAPALPRYRLDPRRRPCATARGRHHKRSVRGAIVVVHGNRIEVDPVQAAQVHRRHRPALRVDAFAIRMDAAGGAEAVLDHALVEGVGAGRLVRRAQAQAFARHEPQQRAAAAAQRAIAGDRAIDLAFDLEGHGAAVTASFMQHDASPVGSERG